jgi:predicted nucleic acid-binding Zn ribbon protein
MKDPDPREIGKALAALLGELGIGPRLKQYEVVERWHELVGEQISRVTVPERMDNGKLFVHVLKATWRNELIFLKAELIAKINQALGQEIVKDIIFR